MEEKELLQKQFLAEGAALKRKIRSNINARRFGIFVLVANWAILILEAICLFRLGNDITLKYIDAQNRLRFQMIISFIYTLWCVYSISKGKKICCDAIDSFYERWRGKVFEATTEKPEELDEGVALEVKE